MPIKDPARNEVGVVLDTISSQDRKADLQSVRTSMKIILLET